ncbi:DUF4262 domain-containing protein [Amycolatopsis alkalitolerans]|uniref:DUF4262 domain-containing protein n=1 Tax=Amycolatopsis alkalitolerans TaxID=2547244 RepID=A0A5C4M3H5_9PSEU|nr:DUF4262 domain-containing protein [Amycolatopsis alkalitolerans]TNC26433.1 DUF4262 domain-containing protein [Amycolatopsis alkalitolerans]
MTAVTTETTPDVLAPEDHELLEWIVSEAERRGNAVISVPRDDKGSGYCFTACVWAMHQVPEAVVIGLPEQMAQVLLDAYVDRAATGGAFVPGQVVEDFFDGVPVTFEQVNPGHYPEFLGSAFVVYPEGDFPALQIIVATPEGKWPWDADAPEGFAQWQPVLTGSGRPESWTPGVDGP